MDVRDFIIMAGIVTVVIIAKLVLTELHAEMAREHGGKRGA
ncbi:MAG: hypothetical protein QF486_05675 [Candidatus Woesearchaeota archaeon]|jgi:hypothetical protein|nr:hypothetical protein [Candidatus Woesearchaeota archaeon]MDP7182143.1 hypothetical protein [Candidatus Woesearchaeota archaeon]MDP7199077.1 hypothetical protein [Candidatus Woesearchaeota archaeon]MDP7467787.1 hypothetical protein [Candidatus Woesearchaeota archaeon]MDP7646490.1 hypothetical protein [Candidatus Woesearchaeota archaeon]